MTAADLVAGARALIEPLTGHTPGPWETIWNWGEIYAPVTEQSIICMNEERDRVGDMILGPREVGDLKIIAVAPVMRDTIAALLDDRDAQTQRIKALEAALRDLLPLADEGAAQPGHTGSCGPWESCDSLCMDAAHDARALSAARAALRADEVAQ